MVEEAIGGAQNPFEVYQIVSSLMEKPEDIPITIHKVG